jgi:hypothetical protein
MLPEKFDKKIEAAPLPQKTKDQLRAFLDGKELTDTQFRQIFRSLPHEGQRVERKTSSLSSNAVLQKWHSLMSP